MYIYYIQDEDPTKYVIVVGHPISHQYPCFEGECGWLVPGTWKEDWF